MEDITKLFDRIANLERDLNNAFNEIRDFPNKISNFGEELAEYLYQKLVRPPIDEIEECYEKIEKEINETVDLLLAWPTIIGEGLGSIFSAIDSAFQDLNQVFDNMFKACFDNDGVTVCYGIDNMIEDFKRIICALDTVPNRVENVLLGISNIFAGVGEFFNKLEVSAGEFLPEVQTLYDYNILFFGRYLACFTKFALNFFKCFVYYLIDFVGKLLYLPVSLTLWLLFTFLAIDLYPIEKTVFSTLDGLDLFLQPILGFSILRYPKHIREDCYTCIRLRGEVITYQTKEVGKAFRKQAGKFVDPGAEKRKDPNGKKHVITDNNEKLAIAYNNFREVTAFPQARRAGDVDSSARTQ